MTKVSIVLPVYNGEMYLEKAIEGIINQTFQDWELIIVNDCSTDSSVSIAEKYKEKDSRIRIIHNSVNKKLPGSLNIGFASAKGEYLTWTSDDNIYLPMAIEEMVNVLEANSSIFMVRTDMEYIDADDNIIGISQEYTDDKMYDFNCFGACFMYRREVLETIGTYDEETFCVEDYDYWLRVLDHYGHIETINKILYLYRRHDGSLSVTKRKKVAYQLALLRCRYIDTIFSKYFDKKDVLVRMYFEMMAAEYMPIEIKERFEEIFPELKCVSQITEGEKVVVFGAGVYGRKLLNKSIYDIKSFIDNDSKKKDGFVENIPVKMFKEFSGIQNDYPVVIAVAPRNIYFIMKQLYENGIKQYGVFLPYF